MGDESANSVAVSRVDSHRFNAIGGERVELTPKTKTVLAKCESGGNCISSNCIIHLVFQIRSHKEI